MAAPAWQATANTLGTTATSLAVSLPASIAANDIVVVIIYREHNTTTVTPPAGFVEKTNVTVGGASDHGQWIYWKRMAGGETGTVTFSWSGTANYTGAGALRISGCVSSGDPWGGVTGAVSSGAVTATPAVSFASTAPDSLLIWSNTNFAGTVTYTVPSGYTDRTSNDVVGKATKDNTAGGATGSVSGTDNFNDWQTSFLGYLISVSPAPDVAPLVEPFGPGLGGPWGPWNAQPWQGTGTEEPTPSPDTQATADVAAAIGSALDASVALEVAADVAAGSGVGFDGTAAVALTADVASGTGTGLAASVAIAATANAATAAGAALDAAARVEATADVAAGTGSAVGAVAAGAYRDAVTADSPSVWWHLDETTGSTFADAVGSQPLTITGSPTLGGTGLESAAGLGIAPSFSTATMNYGEAAASSTFNGSGSGLTVEALIQSTGVDGNNRIVEYGADTAWALYVEGGSLKFSVFGHASAAVTWAGGTARHHVAGTYDPATGTAVLYLDGVEVGRQVATSGAPTSTTDPLRLAQKPTGTATGDGWNGVIDEAALYGTVLTPSRVAAHAVAAGFTLPGTSATADVAAGTGTGFDASVAVALTANVSTAAGSAFDASVALAVTGDVASATGTAYDATISTAALTNASADVAAGTGTANDAAVFVAASANVATGVASSLDATAAAAVTADVAAGTASSLAAAAAIAATADQATAAGTALDATASVSGSTNANADIATASGTALDASAAVAVNAEVAAGTGTGLQPTPALEVTADAATATAAAFDASVSASGSISASADAAAAVGQAFDAAAAVGVSAGISSGTGSAFDASVSTLVGTQAAAGLAVGAGSGFDAAAAVAAVAGVAAGFGEALPLVPPARSGTVRAGTEVPAVIRAGVSSSGHARQGRELAAAAVAGSQRWPE